jgi:hypothetical protein
MVYVRPPQRNRGLPEYNISTNHQRFLASGCLNLVVDLMAQQIRRARQAENGQRPPMPHQRFTNAMTPVRHTYTNDRLVRMSYALFRSLA